MSAEGHKPTFQAARVMSALNPITDIRSCDHRLRERLDGFQ
jgi:hypothetical protein